MKLLTTLISAVLFLGFSAFKASAQDVEVFPTAVIPLPGLNPGDTVNVTWQIFTVDPEANPGSTPIYEDTLTAVGEFDPNFPVSVLSVVIIVPDCNEDGTFLGTGLSELTIWICILIPPPFNVITPAVYISGVAVKCPCVVQPGIKCDPHFKTWSGDKFDFHGECDLVLLHQPNYKKGLGLDIHVRTKIERFYSYIETAVVKLGNDILEITGGPSNEYWLNGEEGVELPTKMGDHSVGFQQIDDNSREYSIYLNGRGERIVIKTYKHFVSVYFKFASMGTFGSSTGVLGDFVTGKKIARDGKTVMEDVIEYGMEWQVRENEPKLFRTVQGPQYPEQCRMPTEKFPGRRRLGEARISEEEAMQACARVTGDDLDICIFDVMATNDLGIAGSY